MDNVLFYKNDWTETATNNLKISNEIFSIHWRGKICLNPKIKEGDHFHIRTDKERERTMNLQEDGSIIYTKVSISYAFNFSVRFVPTIFLSLLDKQQIARSRRQIKSHPW